MTAMLPTPTRPPGKQNSTGHSTYSAEASGLSQKPPSAPPYSS